MKPRKEIFWLKPDLLLLCVIVLGIFALYAGSLQMVAAHDDVVNLDAISQRSLLQLFDPNPWGTGYYRPMSFVPWFITRALFGWYQPAILHFWNLLCEVLNTALVGVLAARLAQLFGIHSRVLPVVAALVFGLYPFNYQAVLWAGALPHPLATTFGLFALHAYLSWRGRAGCQIHSRFSNYQVLLAAFLLVLAALSAEEGIVFSLLVCLIELVSALRWRRRPSFSALLMAGVALAYVPLYLWFLRPAWRHISGQTPSTGLSDVFISFVYQAQGVVAWVVILLRPIVGLPSNGWLIILIALGVVCLGGMALLWTRRMWPFGILSLGWWGIAIVPSLILLSPDYVLTSPRLMYIASVGIALFDAALVMVCLRLLRRPVFQALFLALLTPLFVWGGMHLSTWVSEVARVPAALREIDADVRTSNPATRILLINTPAWVAPAVPEFFAGIESMPIYRQNMLAAVNDTQREEQSVRHDISLTHNDRFSYIPYGNTIDDTALRSAILQSDRIYKFDYDDPPGMRASLVGVVDRSPQEGGFLVRFTRGGAQATLRAAQAEQCGGTIQMHVTWSDVKGITEPVSIFVHALDAAGQQVAVADRDLLDGYLPLDRVPAGVTITETRQISLTASSISVTTISMGIYTRSDVQRYQTYDAAGVHLDGDALSVPVQHESRACR